MNLQLKELRKLKGLRQEDLAKELMTTSRIVGSWERGETALPLEDACSIADVLECTLDELAGRVWLGAGEVDGERRLVALYRGATPRQRRNLVDIAETFHDGGLAKNNPDALSQGIA